MLRETSPSPYFNWLCNFTGALDWLIFILISFGKTWNSNNILYSIDRWTMSYVCLKSIKPSCPSTWRFYSQRFPGICFIDNVVFPQLLIFHVNMVPVFVNFLRRIRNFVWLLLTGLFSLYIIAIFLYKFVAFLKILCETTLLKSVRLSVTSILSETIALIDAKFGGKAGIVNPFGCSE